MATPTSALLLQKQLKGTILYSPMLHIFNILLRT
jgi:hypothetical protein